MIPGIIAGGMQASGAAPVASTFDPTLKGSGVALSNGDLDAQKSGAGYRSVYGTQGRGAGRRAFEVIVMARTTASSIMIGIADKSNPTAIIANYIGNNSGSVEAIGANDSPARYFRRMTVGNTNGSATSSSYSLDDVITVDVDMSASTVTFFRNGTLITPSGITITSGKTYFPVVSLQSGSAVRLRTAALAFLPVGATEWG